MVSFSCEACGDVLTKRKLDVHRNQCAGASFTCLDCMVNFKGTDYRAHTSCISEAQKYQGALYRSDKERKPKQANSTASPLYRENVKPSDHHHHHPRKNKSCSPIPIPEKNHMPPPKTPLPKCSRRESMPANAVNVFDFLIHGATPNASTSKLLSSEPTPTATNNHTPTEGRSEYGHSTESVRDSKLIPNGRSQLPKANRRSEGRKEKRDRADEFEHKECKRLHLETKALMVRDSDETMSDVPSATCHTGLTGDLNRVLSRPEIFPPTPDFSGKEIQNLSPRSPLNKTKPAKKRAHPTIRSSIRSFVAGRPSHHSVEERMKPRQNMKESARSTRHNKSNRKKSLVADVKSEDKKDHDMVVFQPMLSPVELLFSFINKGPESSRGVSMNKALKKYHRERQELGVRSNRAGEEKELWRSLRLKRNDRGEIVLFVEQ